MTHAYDEDYLYHAQNNFGHMIDFAVNTCEYGLSEYFQMFLASNVCRQFENGNPAYIAGKTGCELVRLVVSEICEKEIEEDDTCVDGTCYILKRCSSTSSKLVQS